MGALLSCAAINLCECAACMACSCCTSIISATLAQAARFGHMLIILVTFCIAIVLGQSYTGSINGYNYYTKVNITGGCDSAYEDECMYRQLIYRASFALVILFVILAIGSTASDYINRSLWVLKFGLAIGLFVAFWWADNGFFNGWAETARVISFIWLLVQGLLLLDFCHDVHDLMMPANATDESDTTTNKIMYLVFSFCGFFAAVLGLVYLFLDYSGCGLGMFFIIFTLIMGVLTTITSLLDSVGRGLITPCLMFAYSVFLCWYALLSNPHESCNPTANDQNGTLDGAMTIVVVISTVIMLYCVCNGTKILNIFNPQGEGVIQSYAGGQTDNSMALNQVLTGDDQQPKAAPVTQQPAAASAPSGAEPGAATAEPLLYQSRSPDDESDSCYRTEPVKSSGTPHERGFYHVLMVLVSCYGCMILTSWGKTDGSPIGANSSTAGNESMWLKIVSQWVFILLYWRVLQVSYQMNSGN